MKRRVFLACSIAAFAGPELDLPDFSSCGYRGGGVALPDLPVRLALKPESGDATSRIQSAIDRLAARPAAERGAILLGRGQYAVQGTLTIPAGGIVLRGEGSGENGTVLVATGAKARSLIEIRGAGSGAASPDAVAVADDTVPVGAVTLRLAAAGRFRKGQLVIVRRIGNAGWISEIGMDRIKGRPGDEASTRQWTPFNLDFERVITAVDGDRITLDAPVLCAIEKRWGGGEVLAFDDSARLRDSGLEHLRAVSEFNRSVTAVWGREKETYFADEEHARSLVSVDNANDCWVRGVVARRFSFALADVRRTRSITVEGCDCGEMVSQITGSRRYPYSLNGQRALVRNCTSDTARHDFAVGSRVAGPNVFLDCTAGRSFATSEPHHRWSVGGLFDNVKANIAIQDRQYMGTGHGWAGANYVVWNCEGSLVCQKPPTANNWAIGHVGKKEPGAFAPRPDGTWISYGKHVTPRSLYESQLAARLSRPTRP